jgi:hypothetical protein
MDKTERQQVRGWLGIDLEQYSHIVHCQLCDITTIDDRMKQLDLTHERIKVALDRIWQYEQKQAEGDRCSA